MDFGHLTGLVIIVFIFGGGFIKRILDMTERRMEAKIATQDKNVDSEIAALRKELERLRDTSTQYDMSIEHRLDDLDRRLGSIESHGRPAGSSVPAQEEPQQTISSPRL